MLHHSCRLGGPQCFSVGGESKLAHKFARRPRNPCRPMCPEGFREGEHSRKVPTSGPGGYITTTTLGVPNASKRAVESQVAHKWARLLHNPCRVGGPRRFRARGAESKMAHKWGGWLHNPCRLAGPQCFRAGERIIGSPHVGQVAT